MAAAGEGRAPYDGGVGGGAGGKFRKRPFKRSQASTPYDRPPIAIRNSNSSSLLSKLVDRPSKFLYASAYRLFGAFRNRLTLPPPPQRPPEADHEPSGRLEVGAPNMVHGTTAPEPGHVQDGNLAITSVATEISELEHMLKQRSFTRSEIKRLTELLRSRTSELPVEDEERAEPQIPSSTLKKDRNETDTLHASGSTPVVSPMVFNEDVASPAELAKAYMGSRPSKVSPSMLGLRNRALREDSSLLSNGSFLSPSPISLQLSLASKTSKSTGVSENGFTTPRSRGRSAIYSMARTPYSRIHSTASQKVIGSTSSGYGGPSSSVRPSQPTLEQEGPVDSMQTASKRRSSVLEDDIGSVGPMRRIRRKPNLLSQGGPLSSLGRENGYNDAPFPVSSTKKLLLSNEPEHKVPKSVIGNGHTNKALSGYFSVPTKSSELASRIIKHLDDMSPEGRPAQSKGVFPAEKSATKLTQDMLHGQALRSLGSLDSSKFLNTVQEGHKLEDLRGALLPAVRNSTMQKDNDEENGSKMFAVPRNMLTPVNSDATVSGRDSGTNIKSADSFLKLATEPPQKKRAFQMSAHEDFLEVDDDIHCNGAVSTSFVEKTKNLEASVTVSEASASEDISLCKIPAHPESKISVDSVCNQRIDFGTSNGSAVSEEKTGPTFFSSPTMNTTSQSPVRTESTLTASKFVPLEESNASPSSINPKPVDKVQPLSFTSFSSESSGKVNSSSDAKLESVVSFPNGASVSVATNGQMKAPVSDKDNDSNTQYTDAVKETLPSAISTSSRKNDSFSFGIPAKHAILNNTPKAADVVGSPETVPSSVSAATTKSGIFSFDAPAKPLDQNNGTLASNPSFFSSSAPVLASSNFSNQIFNNSSHAASSTISTLPSGGITTTSTSSKGLSTSATFPIYSFGSSVPPATSVSEASTSAPVLSTSGAETTDSKPKSDQGQLFVNTASPLFGGSSSTNMGISPFRFSSPADPSTAKSRSQVSLFSTGSGSLTNTQASGAANATQSVPFQFGSSAASPAFGTPASSSFSTSAARSANPFSSATTSFGQNSAASSSDAISGSSATPSIFGSGWQPSKFSGFGSTLSSPSPSTGFSFGGASTSVATSSNAPSMVFGSSTTGATSGSPMFSFGAGAATTSSFPSFSQTPPVFGNSNPAFTSPSGMNNDQMGMEDSMFEDPVHSAAPAVPAYGQPSPAPAVPPFGQQPSTSFMFGSAPSASAPSAQGVPFQFGGQPNPAAAQNLSPFQASSSLEFSAGGSFSLGSGGGDKSQRRTVRVSRNKNRKK